MRLSLLLGALGHLGPASSLTRRTPRSHSSLIAIGEGAEAEWLPTALPGQAHRVKQTSDLATTLRTILSSALGGEL